MFRALILKFKYKTPGREDADDDIEFKTKEEYRASDKNLAKMGSKKKDDAKDEENSDTALAKRILEGLGGADNIDAVTNCATRLRVDVKDTALVKDDKYFKSIGTHGAQTKGKNVQVIVGLTVNSVREEFESVLGFE